MANREGSVRERTVNREVATATLPAPLSPSAAEPDVSSSDLPLAPAKVNYIIVLENVQSTQSFFLDIFCLSSVIFFGGNI